MSDDTSPPAEGVNTHKLTRADLEAAFATIAEAERQVCGVTYPHLVHPQAEGWTACANLCGGVFYVAQVDGFPRIVDPPSSDERDARG